MRNRKAKAIRKLVYRDAPKEKKTETKYIRDPNTGTIYATEYRRAYVDAKKILKERV